MTDLEKIYHIFINKLKGGTWGGPSLVFYHDGSGELLPDDYDPDSDLPLIQWSSLHEGVVLIESLVRSKYGVD